MRFSSTLNTLMRCRSASWLFASGFARSCDGAIAIIFALALPALALIVAGGIDLAFVQADHSKAQDVADQAALAAAKQVGLIDTRGVQALADRFVEASLSDTQSRFHYKVETDVNATADEASVTVHIAGQRDSFFGNLLPPGGWHIAVSSKASSMGRVPLCVLATGRLAKDMLEIKDQGQITAIGCAVHANGDIKVSNAGWLQATLVEAAGLASGRISPSPQQGAQPLEDPFAAADVETPKSLCVPADVILGLGLSVYPPGVHCGDFKVQKGSTLRLLPGEHYFIGKLELTDDAILEGDDVVLVFDKKSDFHFRDKSQISLSGRKSGKFAGFVLGTTRKNNNIFDISSDSARRLLGTIYIPNATLQVTGDGNNIADKSPWTVIVAKSIKMTGRPNLVLNSKYDGSSVPVPRGVGPNSSFVALTH